jgi:hypothetical protein
MIRELVPRQFLGPARVLFGSVRWERRVGFYRSLVFLTEES